MFFRVRNRNLIDKFREKKKSKREGLFFVGVFSRINSKNNKAIRNLKKKTAGVWMYANLQCDVFKFIMVSNVVE